MKKSMMVLVTLVATCVWAQEPTRVMTASFQEVAFRPAFDAPATVAPRNDTNVASETTGIMETVHGEVGDYVENGSLLVSLDCRKPKLDLQRARGELAVLKAQLQLAVRQEERAKALLEDDHVSEELFDMRANETAVLKARIQVQKAMVDDAKLAVEKCRIQAPFDGYIVERHANRGQMAQPGGVLFRLIETRNPEVAARVSMPLLGHLEQGVDLAFAWNDKHLPVKLERNPPVLDPSTRGREVRLSFTGESAPPGATGRLTWRTPWRAVPAHLVVKRGDRYGVMVADGNTARFQPLEGAVEGRPARADLALDTLLITEGRLGLEDKDEIVKR